MSDVALAPQRVVRTGLAASYTGSLSTSNTYQVNNSGHMILHFKKSSAVDCVVTVDTPETVDGLAVAQRTVTVPATTGDKFIGPFPPGHYNQPGTNYLEFTLSDVAGLTVAALVL